MAIVEGKLRILDAFLLFDDGLSACNSIHNNNGRTIKISTDVSTSFQDPFHSLIQCLIFWLVWALFILLLVLFYQLKWVQFVSFNHSCGWLVSRRHWHVPRRRSHHSWGKRTHHSWGKRSHHSVNLVGFLILWREVRWNSCIRGLVHDRLRDYSASWLKVCLSP